MVSAFLGFALASVIIIHLRVCATWIDALAVLAGTMLFSVVDLRILHFHLAFMAWLSFAGMSSLIVFAVRAIWAEQLERKLFLLGFVPALLFVVSEYFAGNMLQWTAANHPKVLDLYLYSFDSSLGVQIPFLAGQAFATWRWLRFVAVMLYIGLPIPIAVAYSGQLLRVREKAIPSMIAFLATGPIGILFYNLFPALGPVHLFREGFPWHPLTIEQASRLLAEPVAIFGPPNAIPSLHMAWVLLVWWYSRGLSWWERLIAMLFLAFTVLATLGTGEHYFIDLIVAFPFALMVESVCAFNLPVSDRSRWLGFCVGLAGTLGWFALLRHSLHFFWMNPLLPWSFCILTVTVSLLCERQMQSFKGAAILADPVPAPALSPIS
jgi:small basic protein